MLEFSWRKTDKNNVPVMSAKEMDELAEMLIHDYKHALIKEPQPINYEHFLEVYLGVNLQYLDITADATILGMTAFDDGRVQVYDHELGREKSIDITEGSVMLGSGKAFEVRLRGSSFPPIGDWYFPEFVELTHSTNFKGLTIKGMLGLGKRLERGRCYCRGKRVSGIRGLIIISCVAGIIGMTFIIVSLPLRARSIGDWYFPNIVELI